MVNLENDVLNKILGDLEEYLRITGGLETRQDNPQTMRIRQHFEKKNKKYSHELAQLQVLKRLFELKTFLYRKN
jgi:cell shape-determining protein MreC